MAKKLNTITPNLETYLLIVLLLQNGLVRCLVHMHMKRQQEQQIAVPTRLYSSSKEM